MTQLIAFDPGLSTGVVVGHYSDTEPWRLHKFWQIEGGLEGFLDWDATTAYMCDDAVAERFVPLAGQGFSHTAGSVEPLRVEGALVALAYMPADPTADGWQRASQQYWATGANAKEKRKKQKAWVKENHPELYKTGKDVGCKDAEDYWSALFHSLARMRHLKHGPTLKHYFPTGG